MTHPDIAFATELNAADIDKAIRRARKLRAQHTRAALSFVFVKPVVLAFNAIKSVAALAVVPVARPLMRMSGNSFAH